MEATAPAEEIQVLKKLVEQKDAQNASMMKRLTFSAIELQKAKEENVHMMEQVSAAEFRAASAENRERTMKENLEKSKSSGQGSAASTVLDPSVPAELVRARQEAAESEAAAKMLREKNFQLELQMGSR